LAAVVAWDTQVHIQGINTQEAMVVAVRQRQLLAIGLVVCLYSVCSTVVMAQIKLLPQVVVEAVAALQLAEHHPQQLVVSVEQE